MTIKVYTLPSNNSSRKVIRHFEENKLDYKEYRMDKTPMTWDQYLEILVGTENGIDDIISVNSKAYKDLLSKGVDFYSLTLSRFYEIMLTYPTIIKAPIMYDKNTTLIGYNEEEMRIWQPRKLRRSSFLSILKEVRKKEDANGMYKASHTKYD